MEIIKEQIEKIFQILYLANTVDGARAEIEKQFREWHPEAFEMEYRKCVLFIKENLANGSLTRDVDTGVWEIFDDEENFYLVTDEGDWIVEFSKSKGIYFGMGEGISRFKKWYRARKKEV